MPEQLTRLLVFASGRYLFFFHEPPTTGIYTLSLHDALPICGVPRTGDSVEGCLERRACGEHESILAGPPGQLHRSEEHTSELQSQFHLVCRLLLEKKNQPTQ